MWQSLTKFRPVTRSIYSKYPRATFSIREIVEGQTSHAAHLEGYNTLNI